MGYPFPKTLLSQLQSGSETLTVILAGKGAQCPVGGCLAHFGRNWEKVSTDPWVIETLSGSRLELRCAPQQKSSPGRIHLDAKKAQALSKEVQARPGHKRSHSISSGQQGGLYLASVLDQSNVPCPKVRWLMATGDKFEVTQQVRGYSPFQDGINQDGKRANPKRGNG